MTTRREIRIVLTAIGRLGRGVFSGTVCVLHVGTQPYIVNLSVSLRIDDFRFAFHCVGCAIDGRDDGPNHALRTLYFRERPKAWHGGRIVEVPLTLRNADKIANRWVGRPSGTQCGADQFHWYI